LFSKQSDPWKEEELLSQWQRELPGIGDLYRVSLDMLSGVALLAGNGLYKYFSEEKLPTDLEKRFGILFCEKEKWTPDELKPYVQRLATGKLSETDLLLRYTRFVTEDVNGVATKFVVKR
jgi:sister chromatid cohesion protein DCC1